MTVLAVIFALPRPRHREKASISRRLVVVAPPAPCLGWFARSSTGAPRSPSVLLHHYIVSERPPSPRLWPTPPRRLTYQKKRLPSDRPGRLAAVRLGPRCPARADQRHFAPAHRQRAAYAASTVSSLGLWPRYAPLGWISVASLFLSSSSCRSCSRRSLARVHGSASTPKGLGYIDGDRGRRPCCRSLPSGSRTRPPCDGFAVPAGLLRGGLWYALLGTASSAAAGGLAHPGGKTSSRSPEWLRSLRWKPSEVLLHQSHHPPVVAGQRRPAVRPDQEPRAKASMTTRCRASPRASSAPDPSVTIRKACRPFLVGASWPQPCPCSSTPALRSAWHLSDDGWAERFTPRWRAGAAAGR